MKGRLSWQRLGAGSLEVVDRGLVGRIGLS